MPLRGHLRGRHARRVSGQRELGWPGPRGAPCLFFEEYEASRAGSSGPPRGTAERQQWRPTGMLLNYPKVAEDVTRLA
jgi:hypothetical protein